MNARKFVLAASSAVVFIGGGTYAMVYATRSAFVAPEPIICKKVVPLTCWDCEEAISYWCVETCTGAFQGCTSYFVQTCENGNCRQAQTTTGSFCPSCP